MIARWGGGCALASAMLLAGSAVPLAAQAARAAGPTADSIARFLALARSGTARYQDQRSAIADGYALVGPDFPGMGEHWINMGLVFSRTFDAARPAILEYASIAGRPTLVGVAFALPLLAGETAPDFPSVEAWHAHRGTVDEEARLIEQVAEPHHGMGGARLAMLHLWVWLDNPAGVWASDNWALPFVRAGLEPPASVDAVAGRAMSLAVGGERYFTVVLEAEAARSPGDSAAIRDAITRATGAVDTIRSAHTPGPIMPAELAALRVIWRTMWEELEAGASLEARAPMTALARELRE